MPNAPHLLPEDGPDEEAEHVIRILANLYGSQPWRISDEKQAEWCMSKARFAAAEIAQAEVLAKEYRDRIDAWLADRTRRARATSDWARAHLERWGRERFEADPKAKTLVLPSGKVASTAGRLEWVVEDEALAIRWATDVGLDDLVESKLVGVQKLSKALVADEARGIAGTPEGEMAQGITIRRRERTWRVTPDG